MKKVFSVLLVSVATLTLAGCQSNDSSKTQQSTKQETSQVSKNAQSKQASSNTSKKTAAAESSDKTTSDASSSKQTSSTSDSATSQSQTQQQTSDQTTANAQNLTSQQVQNWVARYLDGNYQTGDLTYTMNKDQNGELLIQVKENHQSTNMQNQGADPNTSPTIGWFKVNSQGQLLKSPDAGASWNVVSNSYQ